MKEMNWEYSRNTFAMKDFKHWPKQRRERKRGGRERERERASMWELKAKRAL